MSRRTMLILGYEPFLVIGSVNGVFVKGPHWITVLAFIIACIWLVCIVAWIDRRYRTMSRKLEVERIAQKLATMPL